MLSDITVVEIGGRVSTAYCGKLLRDAGATVVKVEPPAGDPMRTTHPGYAAFLHGGKRSVTATGGPAAARTLRGLYALADVVICDDDDRGLLDCVLSLRDEHQDLLVAAISDYGLDGPAAGQPATDFTLQAEGGISVLHATGDRPPVAAGVELSELSSGVAAAVGVVTALLHAEAGGSPPGGRGRRPDADISRFESVVALLQYPWLAAQIEAHSPYPVPQNAVPGLERAKDGWVCAVAVTPPQWADFRKIAGIGELDDARYALMADRMVLADEVTPLIRRFTTRHTVAELVEMGTQARVPITPVGTSGTLPGLAPYAARGVYVAGAAGVLQPRSPFWCDGADWAPGRLAGIGEDNGRVLGGHRQRPARSAPPDPGKPLAGLRVLELGTFQAGPLVGMNLAALGADVIKVEAVDRPDLIRFTSNMAVNRFWERAAGFLGPNLGKRGITADFNRPDGLEIIHRLIARSDVVLDNFLPRVLEGRGLDYAGVSRIRPDVIMVRMPAWGLTGPWRDRPGFTFSVNATSGLSELTGYPDRDPLLTGTIIDPAAALFTTFITLAAIRRRQLTGRGGLIEVPLCDVAAQLTARAVIAAVSGTEPARAGNHSMNAAPQGIYRCADGRWLAVSVATDQQWAALAALPEAAGWAGADRFRALPGRLEHRVQLDERLAAWAGGQHAAELATRLREAGIAAAVLETGAGFAEHPQLLARERVFTLDHESVGPVRYLGPPARYASAPAAWASSAAPLFGQHNHEILRELGYREADIEALLAAHAIGDAPAGLTFDRPSCGPRSG